VLVELNSTIKGLSFIAFARNEAFDFLETLESLKELGDRLAFPIEIVAIDDGSNDQTFDHLENYSKKGDNPYLVHIVSQPPLGISTAIAEGLKLISYEKCVPIPGHFMFDAAGLYNLAYHAYSAEVVIGFRSNLRKERPVGKYLAAKILKWLFYFSVSKKVVDPHGLIVYPTALLRDVIHSNMEHENHIRALAYAVGRGQSILNLPVPIRVGHKARSKERGRPSAPRLVHLRAGIRELHLARKFKNSQIES
jgi:glycosyltransferase involved in cell wall biosynthesis